MPVIWRCGVREIIRNPFYVGYVAHYPTRPLDMEDDPENARRRKTAPVKNRRQPQILQPGQHAPIYPREIWEKNISMRKAKGSTASSCEHPRREYLLTGIGRCWICLEKSGSQVGFRGSTGSGLKYYRCATLLEKSKKAKDAVMFDDYLVKADVQKQPKMNWEQLIKSHTTPTIRSERLDQQVEEMMMSLVIPESWHAMIAAYFLNNDGNADFERETYNLRRELERLQNLYTDGFISKAKFQEQAMAITSEMKKVEVMEQPEVKQILPYLRDFSKTWSLMNENEKRSLVRIVFEAIYFDDQATIRRISANEPFDQLLGISKFNLN